MLFGAVFAAGCLLIGGAAGAQTVEVSASHPNGVYAPGETIAWTVHVAGADVKTAHYQIKKGGGVVLAEGEVALTGGDGRIETTQTAPLAYLADVTVPGSADNKPVHGWGGAVVAPDKITASLPRPADFDSFWQRKLKTLDGIPLNPQIEKADSERAGVEYSKITLDNINGTKVRAQLARPATGTKFPAVIILQWAGVYGLPKYNVTNYAAQGWLALNVMAHDLPFDQPPAFYQEANNTTLKNYANIGDTSRETSYFLRMVLGCVQASRYLMSRPDWDGRILVATGTSQGGFQSVALTALQPRVSAVIVNVPAGADTGALADGRQVPWPYWAWHHQGGTPDAAAALETSRYFDNINFASRIRVPALVAVGLIDQTSTPSGVLAMANAMRGPKEVVLMPRSEHQEKAGSQRPFYDRSGAWLQAIRTGQAPPIARP